MIGYIDSSSFPVYTYGEMMLSSSISPDSKYYIWWTPSNISSGTFTMEGSTYNFSDYNGSFEFEGGIIQSSAFQNTLIQTLNTNAKEIEEYAFQSCTSLSWVSLPICESIRDCAFWNCSSLSQLSLPVCSHIGESAFYGCTSLNTITLGWSSVCLNTNSLVFNKTGITSSTGSIFVPSSLVSAYKSANGWRYFSSIIYPINN